MKKKKNILKNWKCAWKKMRKKKPFNNLKLDFKENLKKKYLENKTVKMGLRNRNFSTAFCSHFFTFYSHVFHMFKTHFFTCFSKRILKCILICMFSHVSLKCETMWKHVKKKSVLKMRLEKMWKNAFWKCTWEKSEKKSERHVKKKHIWTSRREGGTWIFYDFLGSSFAAVTLLPAQLLQVENRRGAVQIDRKWTVQIADLLNICSKAMTTRSKKHKIKCRRKRNKASKLL